MNFGVMFLPVFRASTTAFVLGLGVFAALDALRLSVDIPLLSGGAGMLVIWFFVFSLHVNRRRHAGRGVGLSFLPVVFAIMAKGIAVASAVLQKAMESMMAFAESNGIDTADVEELTGAINDPGFVEAWQADMESNPEIILEWAAQSDWASYLGFWGVIALFALWFANMKKSGGSIESA